MGDREAAALVREYHEALNGLWVAFGPEFRDNADMYVVRRMNEILMRGHREYGFPVSAALSAGVDRDTPR